MKAGSRALPSAKVAAPASHNSFTKRHALNIDIICANSSPAKGRVERANKTLQDRGLQPRRLI